MISFLAFAIPLALDLARHSAMWNFDGVACAAALELGWPLYFFHSQHLLYGYLGFLFWKVATIVGLARALPALQLFTSLLACGGLAGLYRVITIVLKDKPVSLCLTLAMGFTAAFWVWSVEAQVYMLGFLPLAWAAFVLLGSAHRDRYWLVGLLHGCAILGHVIHVLWIIPALYWIGRDLGAVKQYVTALAVTVAIPYALVLFLVVLPGHDATHILLWLKGSAGLSPDRSFAWHWPGWNGPWLWLQATAPTLWGSFWPYDQQPTSFPLWAMTAVSMGMVAFTLARSGSPFKDRLAAFSWIWILCYGVFLSTWEPLTLCYRVTDILPLGILLALGLKRSKVPLVLAGLLLTTFLPLNYVTHIRPMHEISNNKVYQDTLTLSKISSPNSLYLTQGGRAWIYLLYFTGRTALNVQNMPPSVLRDKIAQAKRQRPVYLQEGETWKRIP